MVYVVCRNSVVAINRLNDANSQDQAWTSVFRQCTLRSSPAVIHTNESVTVIIVCTSYENGATEAMIVALDGLTGAVRPRE